jgi:hypothetical protein
MRTVSRWLGRERRGEHGSEASHERAALHRSNLLLAKC